MRRLGIVGLCSVAVLACCAMVASTAQAAEVGECLKVPKIEGLFHGHYLDKNCQVAATPAEEAEGKQNKWEWSPGVAPTKAAFTAKLKEPVIINPGAGPVECLKRGQIAGEWTGSKTATETITLAGCEHERQFAFGGECHSPGREAGMIVTSALEVALLGEGEESFNLNNENKPEAVTVGPGEVWEQLRGPGGELGSLQMEYKCRDSLEVRTEGSLSGPIASGFLNRVVPKYEVEFSKGMGAQGDSSEARVGEGPFFPIGKTTLTGVFPYKGAGKVEFRP
jgi:hypothetical protein